MHGFFEELASDGPERSEAHTKLMPEDANRHLPHEFVAVPDEYKSPGLFSIRTWSMTTLLAAVVRAWNKPPPSNPLDSPGLPAFEQLEQKSQKTGFQQKQEGTARPFCEALS